METEVLKRIVPNAQVLSKASNESKTETRNPNLPTEKVVVDGSLFVKAIHDFNALVAERFTANLPKAIFYEDVKTATICNYGVCVQNMEKDYTTIAGTDGIYLVRRDYIIKTSGLYRGNLTNAEIIYVTNDQIIKIGGTKVFDVSGDLSTNIKGNSLLKIKKDFFTSVLGSTVTYTGGDEVLIIGGDDLMTIRGDQKYHVGRSDFVNVGKDSSTNVGGNWDEDINGNQKFTVGSNNKLIVKENSDTLVKGTKTSKVNGAQTIVVHGSKHDIIGKEYNLKTPVLTVHSDVQINGVLDGAFNGQFNLINVKGGATKSGSWLPVPWSSFSSIYYPGVTFVPQSNKFTVDVDGNYSFKSFVEFNLPSGIAVTRVRICGCGEQRVVLGSGTNKHLSTSLVKGSAHLMKGDTIYFEYMTNVTDPRGLGEFMPNKVLSSLTINKL